MNRLHRFIIVLLIFSCSSALWAEKTSVSSGTHKNAILELYTSEGCSSCPPAEAWLSQFKDHDEYPAAELIPLAFFVDYWDYLGWKDRYAHPDYSMRQKMHQINGGIRNLYTPQLVLNAKVLRPAKNLPQRFEKARSTKASLLLDLDIDKNEQSWDIEIRSQPLQTILESKQSLYLAVTENNIVSVINAGENHGRTLVHDYVVREFIGPIEIDVSGNSKIQRQIKLDAEWQLDQVSLVAFVQTMRGEILQAVSWQNQ